MCESTAAEAVDDMQRMDVARIRNGKRPTGGGGAIHTKGRTKRTTTQRAAQSGHQEAAEGPTQETHRHGLTRILLEYLLHSFGAPQNKSSGEASNRSVHVSDRVNPSGNPRPFFCISSDNSGLFAAGSFAGSTGIYSA